VMHWLGLGILPPARC